VVKNPWRERRPRGKGAVQTTASASRANPFRLLQVRNTAALDRFLILRDVSMA
jgi:hypothetical protein